MTAVILAGRHEFVQTTHRNSSGVFSYAVWTCLRCGVEVDPSQPFTECQGGKP